MTLTVQVNGVEYQEAISIRVRRSIKNFLGFFEVEASADEQQRLAVKVGDSVKVLADGQTIFTGYIESLQMNKSSANHSIAFGGRDRTADVFDSSVSGKKSFEGVNNFIDVLKDVLAAGGLSAISVVNEAGTVENFKETDIVAAEVGQTIFEFIEPYARKQQFLVTTNENGNILLMRTGTARLGMNITHIKNSVSNNVLSSSLSKDYSERYNKYITQSQLNPFFQTDEINPENISNQSGESDLDNAIRSSRILEFNAEEDMDLDESFNRAQFENNIRRANSVNYSCVVQGHTVNGQPFRVNRLAFINDEFANISSDMLLHSVEYNYSLSTGSRTKLEFTYPDAFSLQAQQAARDANRTLIGGDW